MITGISGWAYARGMEWWEGFFDEDYVRLWAAAGSFAETDRMVDDVEALLEVPARAGILDVACGFGRVAGPLAGRGYRVTGIDFSADQLRLAEERNPGPEYVRTDMRTPPQGPFDAVLNLFSSFGYFDDPADDAAALAAWARALRPDGVLVMELMHRDWLARRYGQEPDQPGGVSQTGQTDWVTGVRTTTVSHGDVSKTFRIRLYTATDLVRLLRNAGFRQVDAYGSLSRDDLSPDTRLVIRATR